MVIVGHPGRQHAHHLATALADADMLSTYVSGQFNDLQIQNLPGILRRLVPSVIARNSVPFLGAGLNVTRPLGASLGYISRRLPIVSIQEMGEWMGFERFDSELSRIVFALRPKAVIGYEMACSKTFRMAKRLGAVRILDAAACHYRLQDRQLSIREDAITRVGRLIRKKKDAEIELADLLICPSELSAQSYAAAGVPAAKIVVNALGVSAETFSSAASATRAGPIRFVFVANAEFVKGADWVAASVREVQHIGVPAFFDVVGGVKVDARSAGSVQVTHLGHVSHQTLANVFRAADCLLLPSRLESFGMVVLEAMAAGVPVLVSDWAGAAMFVRNGVNGWRFGETLDAFVDRVGWCAKNVQDVRALRPQCVATALQNSWDAYRERAVRIVESAIRG